MKTFFLCLCRPDFMQILLTSALLFLLPLKHRPHWKRNAVCLILPCIVLGSCLQVYYGAMAEYFTTRHFFFLPYLPQLLCAWLLFRVCTTLSAWEAIYGAACAYAAQHIAFCVTTIFFGELSATIPLRIYPLLWAVELLVVIVCALLFGRCLPRDGVYGVSRRQALVTCALVLGVALLLNLVIRRLGMYYSNPALYSLGLVYDMLCCLLILWLQLEQQIEVDWRVRAETERRLRRQMQEQYELSRANVELINRKCHDLKHQIAALRLERSPAAQEEGLRDMERAVMIYDCASQTGNEVLDTVLTQQSLVCEENHISWTCMADGGLLDFMTPVDLYTLFGNALDNAIESFRQIDDPQRRTVAVAVCRHHGAALIQIENYYVHTFSMKDGLPVTTKQDPGQHGYGLKNISDIAARYGGMVRVQTDGDIFILSVFLPLPQKETGSCSGRRTE